MKDENKAYLRFGFTEHDKIEIVPSQCVKCKNNGGGNLCSKFGTKPMQYRMVSKKMKCPELKQ